MALLFAVMPVAASAASQNLSAIPAGAAQKYVAIEDTDVLVDADITLTEGNLKPIAD